MRHPRAGTTPALSRFPTAPLAAFLPAALLLTAVLSTSAMTAPAQAPSFQPASSADEALPGRYIVQLTGRSFDLEEFRAAVLARRPGVEVEALAAELDVLAERDQADFAQAVAALGGRIVHHWWIIDGACVELPDGQLDALRTLPRVVRVEPDAIVHALNRDAILAGNHDAVGAHARKAADGKSITGHGGAVAVLDTGIDANMGSTGRPHASFFRNGNPSDGTGGGIGGSRVLRAIGTSGFGNEDVHGHGSHVAGSAAAASWARGSKGMAPDAGIVGVKISNDGGSAASSWIISGWQEVARHRTTDNIVSANHSFSGSPSLNHGLNTAMDNTAYAADVLIATSAGNGGSDTRGSAYANNALAVGAASKGSHSAASFSARGPLFGTTRTYPDIMGIGVGVFSTLRDNENGESSSSGTSMASPMIAGAAALVRQAQPQMTALETKAVLLNTTRFLAGRNTFGLGLMKARAAVEAALAGDFQTHKLTAQARVKSITANLPAAQEAVITITWMRKTGATTVENLDLRVYAPGGGLVASDLNPSNSYEQVRFTPATAGAYRAEVTWTGSSSGDVDFAIAGAGKRVSQPPVLTAVTPNRVDTVSGQKVTLTGQHLDTAFKLTIGGTDVAGLTAVSDTTVEFLAPVPFRIGAHQLTVATGGGTSNPLGFTVAAPSPAVLTGPPLAVAGFPTQPLRLFGDANHAGVLFLSPSSSPSRLTGIVDLGIGAGFTQLYQFGPLGLDDRGFTEIPLVPPVSTPRIPIHWQAVLFDPQAPSFPLDASTPWTIVIL